MIFEITYHLLSGDIEAVLARDGLPGQRQQVFFVSATLSRNSPEGGTDLVTLLNGQNYLANSKPSHQNCLTYTYALTGLEVNLWAEKYGVSRANAAKNKVGGKRSGVAQAALEVGNLQSHAL
jgi:hypothetical protein